MADLGTMGRAAQQHLATKHAARERALPKSRSAIRLCANAIRAAHRSEFDQANRLLLEAAYFGLCAATGDKKEGTSAFLEKRVPRFNGR